MAQSEETPIERSARIDERLKHVEQKIGNGHDPAFVTREEFSPIRAVVYGLVGMILVAVIAGILALVMNHGR